VSPTFQEEVGYLSIRRDLRVWDKPETVTIGLRSPNEAVRLQALSLLGVTDEESHEPLWSDKTPGTRIGQRVVTPDQVKLIYASLGDDATQYAILAVLLRSKQLTLAAVAAPDYRGGWKRLATLECWCKYELYSGRDALSTFVSLIPVSGSSTPPEHYELVLHASGGGTGIYVRNEAHFRVRDGELRRVIAFVSRQRSCPPSVPQNCTLEARDFVLPRDGTSDATAIERRGEYVRNKNDSELSTDDFGFSHLAADEQCREYHWNDAKFTYQPTGSMRPCG